MRSGMISFLGAQRPSAGDPYWANVVSLLHFDNDIVDEAGLMWTGSPSYSDSPVPVFGKELSSPLGSPSVISTTLGSRWYGVSKFTIEVFVTQSAPTTVSNQFPGIISKRTDGTATDDFSLIVARTIGDAINFSCTDTAGVRHSFSTSAALSIGVRTHVAVDADGSFLRIFVGGAMALETAFSATLRNNSYPVYVGRTGTATNLNWVGKIDELRITRDVSRYTEPFTPPTGPFPNFGPPQPPRLWTPLDLTVPPKIILDDQSPVTEVSGTASVWSDRSGNGWHVTAPSTSARPATTTMIDGSRRVLEFDGGSDRLMFPSGALGVFQNTAAGWMLVIERSAVTDTSDIEHPVVVFTTGDVPTRFGIFHGMNISGNKNRLVTGGRRLDSDGFQYAPVSAESSNEWNVVLGVADWVNGKARQYLNGELIGENPSFQTAGNTSNTATQLASIGAYPSNSPSTFFNGQIAAVIIGSGSLPSAGEIDKLFGWAAWHFGLVDNLPSGHPYKLAPPMV